LSLGTVRRVDCIRIADAKLLLAEEGWHCLSVECKTGCGAIGGTGAGEVEGGLCRRWLAGEVAYSGWAKNR
jgi:hypothetical protein